MSKKNTFFCRFSCRFTKKSVPLHPILQTEHSKTLYKPNYSFNPKHPIMRKFFTLFAAALFATSMFAADDIVIALSTMTQDGNSYVTADLNKLAVKKTHVYVEMPAVDVQGQFTVVGSDNQSARFLYIYKNGGAEKDASRALVMSKTGATIDYTASDIMVRSDNKPYLHFYTEDDFKVKTFGYTFESSIAPILNVDPASIELKVSPANKNPKAEVVFSGRNLAAGEYALTIPNLMGLSVNPTAVTVAEDGTLNAQVEIAYTSEEAKEAAETSVALEIGELRQAVSVTYSAILELAYASSINIEQLVMEHGKSYDIQTALKAANIEFANLDALDSLNSDPSKANCNEPFLGLKLKTEGAYMACWVKAGSTIRLKFGCVNEPVIASINGQEDTWTPVDKELEIKEFTVQADSYMKFTTTSAKTIVIKQIMIDEEIATVELPECNQGQGIEDLNANHESVKFIENGQLYFQTNGEVFNVLGTRIR